MKIYEYTPMKDTKKLATVTGSLLGGAAILVLIYLFVPKISAPWIFQLLAVGMLMLAVFITSRYIMKSYVYAIVEEEGEKLLTVTEIQGRHTITVCRLSLAGLEAAVTVPKGDTVAQAAVKQRIRAEKRKSYNYCIDLFEEKFICLYSEEGGERIAVKVTWEEELEKLIEKELPDGGGEE